MHECLNAPVWISEFSEEKGEGIGICVLVSSELLRIRQLATCVLPELDGYVSSTPSG